MPVTITVPELAAAVRLQASDSDNPESPLLGMLTRQLAVATEICERYAPAASPNILNEGVILVVGWLMEAPPVNRNPVDAFKFSGAQALLATWHTPVSSLVGVGRAVGLTPSGGVSPHILQVVGGLSADATPTASELTIAPTTPGIIPFPAFTDMHVLIWKPASDGALTSVVDRDDSTRQNQITAFTEWGMPIVSGHLSGRVWVSNQLLTFPTSRELEAR